MSGTLHARRRGAAGVAARVGLSLIVLAAAAFEAAAADPPARKLDPDQVRKDMDKYQDDVAASMRGGGSKPTKPEPPKLKPAPEPKEAVKQPEDLSSYVDFLHPWGGRLSNALILLAMFFGLLGATLFALRSQDIG